MARFEERIWEPDFSVPTRRDPSRYSVYRPDLLTERRFAFDGDVADAEADTEGLARLLLRADAARRLGEEVRDVMAAEVLANIDAMVWGVEAVEPGDPITLDMLLEVHRLLLEGSRWLEEHGGRIRTVQNWIGGSGYNPCSAAFVPPPPEEVPALLDDLVAFCNDDGLPALAQAAVAHAQFETIHPFVDGNGRAGRVLIHLVLRRRGVAARFLLRCR